MKYFLLRVCAALKLLESFSSQTCTRGSQFFLQLDNHYDETLLSAQIQSPDFLSISTRTISSSIVTSIYTKFPIEIIALAYKNDVLIILETESLVFFNISNVHNPELLQRYINKSFRKYSKIALGSYIVVYGEKRLALVEYHNFFPVLISEIVVENDISSLAIFDEKIILTTSLSIQIFSIEDFDLGTLNLIDLITPENFSLSSFTITDIYSKNSLLLILEKSLGLFQLSINPLKVTTFYNIFGSRLSVFENTVTIDGQLEYDLIKASIKTYNLTHICEYLAIDSDFIYCGIEDKSYYISRHIPLITQISSRTIHHILSIPSLVFIAFSNGINVISVFLGPVYIEGKIPDKITQYKVQFFLSFLSQEIDKQEFRLDVQYRVKDVIIFFMICLIGLIIFVTIGIIIVFRCCRKKAQEEIQIMYTVHRPVPVNSPAPSDRVPSEGGLV